jgi:hypothetical protein
MYQYAFSITTGMHEAVFGTVVYGLALEFSYLDFSDALGIASFIVSLAVLVYLVAIVWSTWQEINGDD